MSGRSRPRSTGSPLRAEYAQRLKQWRLDCGGPSFRDLARDIDWPTSTIFDRLAGGRNLTWSFIRDFVSACHRYAGLEGEPDLSTWRWDFDQMLQEEAQAAGGVAGRSEPLTVGAAPGRVRGYQVRRGGLEPDPGRTVVLTGPGGVGKTLRASDFADRMRAERRVSIVVWVDAGTRSSVITRFAEAAQAVGIAGDQGPEADAAAFRSWLARPRAPRWLIVFDDLADPAALLDLWPRGRGYTIVTTRRPGAALAAAGREVIPVGLFTPEESARYLAGVLGRDDPDAAAVAAELGHLPLALSQAAAFMADHHLDGRTYLARLRARPPARVVPEPGDLPDDQITPVMATWTMAIRAADRSQPAGVARPLLGVAAMLDAAGIPVAALTAPACLGLLGERLGRPVSEDDARDGLAGLERQNLGRLDGGRRTFRVHQLVQRAVRESLTPEVQRRLVRCAADALLEAWPAVAQEMAYAVLLRANVAALERIDQDALWDGELHQVLFRAGNSLTEERLTEASTDYWERLLSLAQKRLGTEHPDTLTVRNNLAWAHGRAGDTGRALRELRDLLEMRRRVLGPLAVNTLATEHGIACWLVDIGEAAEAVAFLPRLIADYERAPGLGPDSQDTLNTRHVLADALGASGPKSEAVEALRQLLTDCRRALGEEAPVTLDVAVDLAWWLAADGEAAEAAELMESTLPAHVRVYSAESTDTFVARHLSADLHGEAGHATRAVTELRALLADADRVLGPNRPETARIRQSLDTWSSTGRT